jgi:molybdopterin/thiamine biosynthesis adenylyltransferase
MNLSNEEIERYARHIVLREIGGPGQQKLKAARILVVGAGGLGSPVLQYLAAAGVGTLGIADHDTVSLSNLQRQVLFAVGDVGAGKVESAASALNRLNPHVAIEPHAERVTRDNAEALARRYDVVVDGSDNWTTRYAVSDACYRAKRALVTGSVGTFDGAVTTLRPHEPSADGRPNPTYRCLFPAPPAEGSVPTCAETGVIGALTGLVGSLMALEAIREIVPFGEGLVGKLLLVDARSMRFETLRYGWDPDNPLSGREARLARAAADDAALLQ